VLLDNAADVDKAVVAVDMVDNDDDAEVGCDIRDTDDEDSGGTADADGVEGGGVSRDGGVLGLVALLDDSAAKVSENSLNSRSHVVGPPPKLPTAELLLPRNGLVCCCWLLNAANAAIAICCCCCCCWCPKSSHC